MRMKTIPLSPIDHVFTGKGSYPIQFAFAYQGTINAGQLQKSLAEVLKYFPPLQSRLVKISDHSFGLAPTTGGLSFQVVDSPMTFQDAADCSIFLDPVHSIEGEPLAKIRLTQTPGGSVLGVGISHAMADGFSYFHFLASWAHIFHGKTFPHPTHQRELLIPRLSKSIEPVSPDKVLSSSGLFRLGKRAESPKTQVEYDRLNLSQKMLGQLRAEALKDRDVRLTDNDIITAYLWKRYLPLWNRGNGTTYASVPFDFRRALSGFPRTYFGSAVHLAVASADYDTLVNATPGELALLVRRAIAGVNQEQVHASLETLERLRRQEGLAVMEDLHVLHPRSGLLVTNLSQLPVQDIAFNAGPPADFQVLAPAPRGAVVLPAPDGVDVRVYHPLKS